MSKIKVLPASLADKIAAGEVVERPASVVKELVENSMDAGAKNITVEIKRGGISFIRVTDDGCGMEPEDAKTAFLRHATSKIAQDCDLDEIYTYGFRGEALAAICAVSKVELITCTESTNTAYYLTMEGGNITEEDEIGAALGTTVIVRDLFFNTPARLHFLKKDSTEAAAVATMLERLAIGRYDLAFTLISDGKTVFKTSGSRDMKYAIHAIYGPTVSRYLMRVKFEYKNISMSGYVCKSSVMRANRNMQLAYVNDRFVRSKIIYSGIDEAYRANRETGKYPICFLKFNMSPSDVDVNVHPAKLEVKFRDEKTMIVLIKYGIMDLISADNPLFFTDPAKPLTSYEGEFISSAETPEQRESDNASHLISDALSVALATEYTREENAKYLEGKPQRVGLQGVFIKTDMQQVSEPTRQEPVESEAALHFPPRLEPPKELRLPTVDNENPTGNLPDGMKILGEIFKVYVLVEYQDNLYLIDKHAAHEKLIYNRLVKQAKANLNISAQHLLQPIVIALAPSDVDLALQNITAFLTAGFDIHEHGNDAIEITTVPSILTADTFTETFTEALEMLRKSKSLSITDRQDKMLKTVACRSALKGGSECKIEEIMPLIAELVTGKNVGYCPHGRPVVQILSHKEIDKMFKRIK